MSPARWSVKRVLVVLVTLAIAFTARGGDEVRIALPTAMSEGDLSKLLLAVAPTAELRASISAQFDSYLEHCSQTLPDARRKARSRLESAIPSLRTLARYEDVAAAVKEARTYVELVRQSDDAFFEKCRSLLQDGDSSKLTRLQRQRAIQRSRRIVGSAIGGRHVLEGDNDSTAISEAIDECCGSDSNARSMLEAYEQVYVDRLAALERQVLELPVRVFDALENQGYPKQQWHSDQSSEPRGSEALKESWRQVLQRVSASAGSLSAHDRNAFGQIARSLPPLLAIRFRNQYLHDTCLLVYTELRRFSAADKVLAALALKTLTLDQLNGIEGIARTLNLEQLAQIEPLLATIEAEREQLATDPECLSQLSVGLASFRNNLRASDVAAIDALVAILGVDAVSQLSDPGLPKGRRQSYEATTTNPTEHSFDIGDVRFTPTYAPQPIDRAMLGTIIGALSLQAHSDLVNQLYADYLEVFASDCGKKVRETSAAADSMHGSLSLADNSSTPPAIESVVSLTSQWTRAMDCIRRLDTAFLENCVGLSDLPDANATFELLKIVRGNQMANDCASVRGRQGAGGSYDEARLDLTEILLQMRIEGTVTYRPLLAAHSQRYSALSQDRLKAIIECAEALQLRAVALKSIQLAEQRHTPDEEMQELFRAQFAADKALSASLNKVREATTAVIDLNRSTAEALIRVLPSEVADRFVDRYDEHLGIWSAESDTLQRLMLKASEDKSLPKEIQVAIDELAEKYRSRVLGYRADYLASLRSLWGTRAFWGVTRQRDMPDDTAVARNAVAAADAASSGHAELVAHTQRRLREILGPELLQKLLSSN